MFPAGLTSCINKLSSCSWGPAPDRQWGVENEDGSWTGMVGELQKGDGDVLVGYVDNLRSRFKVVDFLFSEGRRGYGGRVTIL